MRSWIYGLSLFLAASATVHLAYVLFQPRLEAGRLWTLAASWTGANSLSVLSPEQQAQLTGEPPDLAAVAVCPYDISEGKLALSAAFPSGHWTLTVYTGGGAPIYAVNDKQAGADSFTVTVVPAASLLDMLSATPAPARSDVWMVETPDDRGLAVLWAATPEPALRERAAARLQTSSCRVEAL